jgi:DNA-binding LacI/PurR family transcriptional regulator
MKALLERDPRPTAVVTVSGVLAVGALTVARGRGVVVPRDLALVSMDDAASNQLAHPPLTSIDLSPYDLGRLAAEMLGTLTSGAPLEEERQVLPVELVIRDSCGSHR